MATETHFKQFEVDGYHFYGIIPREDSLKYELVEEDRYFMNRKTIDYFPTKKAAKDYIKAWEVTGGTEL